MLTKIRLRNFKAFKDTGDIEIAPLTVLTGPNSSGKSAIIQAMMALRQTTENRDPETAFVPVGPYVDLGAYRDFVFRHDVKLPVGIDVECKTYLPADGSGPETASPPELVNVSALVELAYLESIDRVWLAQSTVSLDQGNITIRKAAKDAGQTGRRYRTHVAYMDELSAYLPDSHSAKFHAAPSLRFKDYKSKPGQGRVGQELWAKQIGRTVEEVVIREFALLKYIGPWRTYPQRMYLSPGEDSAAGESAPAALRRASAEAGPDLLDDLSKWCSIMGFGEKVVLDTFESNHFQVKLVDSLSEKNVNLPDAGSGASQIFPVLVQGLTAPLGSTLMLEQPEMHLRPKTQANLADFLIEVRRRGVGVVVETHSEYLVTRMQTRIAEEALAHGEVALYYVAPSPEGSNLERVEINEYGQFPAAPKGFFEDGLEDGFDFIRAVGQRKRKERLARGDE